jgi:hypothetical protein
MSSSLTESEMGSWFFKIGMAVVGFLLAYDFKETKNIVGQVPGLVAQVAALEKALEAAFARIGELEREHRNR